MKITNSMLIVVPFVFALSCKQSNDSSKVLPCNQPDVYCWEYEVISNPNALVREMPNISSKVIEKIPYGSTVKVIERNGPAVTLLGLKGQWLKVQTYDKIGWVFSRLLVPDSIQSDPMTLENGKAVFKAPEGSPPEPLAGKTFSFVQTYGHDVTHCIYAFDQELTQVVEDCCGGWSGPGPEGPYHERMGCKKETYAVTGDEQKFSFGATEYAWNPRVKGYLPQSEIDWTEVFAQAFNGKPAPGGFSDNWRHVPDSCRFCTGDTSCYGGEEANYLCDLDETSNPIRDAIEESKKRSKTQEGSNGA